MPPRSAPSHVLSTDAPEPLSFAIGTSAFIADRLKPGLHIVATPIGNLGDVTIRALETLAGADVIACEDTRITSRLLERYAIRKPLTPYHEHNALSARPKLLARLAAGQAIALVSDAGTPLISDPGFKLVREAQALGHGIFTLPGASSILAALSLAGLPTDRFFFEGFLPSKSASRQKRLAELSAVDATLVFFESGNRIQDTLQDAMANLGQRQAAVCRELTKLHEQVSRGSLADLAANAASLETRGEFVLVVGPPAEGVGVVDDAALDQLLRDQLAHASVKDAVAHAVALSGRNRREVYARALAISQEGRTDGD